MTTSQGERPPPLTVAITGPTGTFGTALVPLLERDDRVGRIVGVARSPFDPAERGWTELDYRQGDVRDAPALEEAFAGADVVVHLAFVIVGGPKAVTHAVNVDGTLNAVRAAAAAGATRFVYASSVAAYGFHPDNPVGMTEDWPTRPAERLFYAQEKAELERRLADEAAEHPDLDLYLLRPPIVLGPDAAGGKFEVPAPLAALAHVLRAAVGRLPVPALVPELALQLVHQDDVAEALRLCVVGSGPPGAYNIAADDIVTSVDLARELGLLAVPLPGGPAAAAARAVSKVRFLPPSLGWVEALSHPAIMDTSRAKDRLGWTPRHSALDSLRSTLG